MRIVLICHQREGRDGWSTYARGLYDILRADHEVVVIAGKGKRSEFPVLPALLRLLDRPFEAVLYAWKLNRILRRLKPDCIHILAEPYALLLPFFSASMKRKTVLTLHGSYAVRLLLSWRTRALALAAYRRTERFIAVSNFTKASTVSLLKKMGKNDVAQRIEERCTVIHNGIALPRPREKIHGNVKQILCVGEVKFRKGILESLQALHLYKQRYGTPFHFHVVGSLRKDSPYVLKVLEATTAHGLSQDVTFHGSVTEQELAAFYQQADLFLLPARTTQDTFEGFGLVYLEANAMGIPCIGPNTSGASEAILEGESGYHVDVLDPNEIAERMHRVLDEGRISPEQCRTWAEKHSISQCAHQTQRVYSLLSPPETEPRGF